MQKVTKASIHKILAAHAAQSGSTISLLQRMQDAFGYLPEEALRQAGASLQIPLSKLFEIATFYNAFSLKPSGKNVFSVCLGTACHVKNGERLADSLSREMGLDKDEETTADGFFTLKTVRCLGCCSIAPVVKINDTINGNVTQATAAALVKKHTKK